MSHASSHRHGIVDSDHNEYEDLRHSSESDESSHSEVEDLAEYWDPYCESDQLPLQMCSNIAEK